jgi:hypothetical protein
MKRIALLIAAALLWGGVAFAQDNPRFEVTGDYSFFRSTSPLSSAWDSINYNGGGGDVTFFLTPHFGAKADFQGYNSANQCANASYGFNGCAGGNLITYMFGPVVKYRINKFEPFGELLFGASHSNIFTNACNANIGLCATSSPTTTAFTVALGGGVDLKLTHHLGVRLFDVDYVPTHFTNNFSGGNSLQNSLRVQTGIQFRF